MKLRFRTINSKFLSRMKGFCLAVIALSPTVGMTQEPTASAFCSAVPYCLSHNVVCVLYQRGQDRRAAFSEAYGDMRNVVSQLQSAVENSAYIETATDASRFFTGLQPTRKSQTLFFSKDGRAVYFAGAFTDNIGVIRDYFAGDALPAAYVPLAKETTLKLRSNACAGLGAVAPRP